MSDRSLEITAVAEELRLQSFDDCGQCINGGWASQGFLLQTCNTVTNGWEIWGRKDVDRQEAGKTKQGDLSFA
jgi:hypothetical protein